MKSDRFADGHCLELSILDGSEVERSDERQQLSYQPFYYICCWCLRGAIQRLL